MHIPSSIELAIGLLLLSGLLAGLIASRFNFPRVAAYIFAGILFSEHFFGDDLQINKVASAETLTSTALGIIAFIIGGAITTKQLRRLGSVILSSAVGAALLATGLVFGVLAIYGYLDSNNTITLSIAITLSVIAMTTAPAGTVAVLHQYRAKGPVTNTILGVVAIDDGIGIIAFSIMLVFLGNESAIASAQTALIEIGGAIIYGLIIGWLMARSSKYVKQSKLRLPMVLGYILISLAIADYLHFSQLLTLMSLGFFVRNFLGAAADRMFSTLEYFEELVFIIFFTIAGTHFQLNVFSDLLLVILLYFFARLIGKIYGAHLGVKILVNSFPNSQWIGFGLIPQAGVAVGLTLTLSYQPAFQEISSIIINIIIANTLLSEITGPFLTKYGLQKAGELGIKRKRK